MAQRDELNVEVEEFAGTRKVSITFTPVPERPQVAVIEVDGG